MSVVSDYPDYAPHVAHADQIAATGVPLLALPQQLYAISSKVIFSASTDFEALVPVKQPGYHCGVSVQFPAAATVPFVKVSLFWTDSMTSVNLASENYIIPGAQSPSVFTALGSGIAKGNKVQLRLTNLDPAQNATVSVTMNADSIPRSGDSWLWENALDSGLTVPGFTLPTLPDDESVLGMLGSVTVPAGGTSSFLFGMHNGPINVGLDQGGGPWTNITLQLAAAPSSAYVGNNPIYAAVNPPPSLQIAGPRSPVRVGLHNSATTAFTATMSLIAAD